jgi:hypothetical protein
VPVEGLHPAQQLLVVAAVDKDLKKWVVKKKKIHNEYFKKFDAVKCKR